MITSSNPIVMNALSSQSYRDWLRTLNGYGREGFSLTRNVVREILAIDDKAVSDTKKEKDPTAVYEIFDSAYEKIMSAVSRYEEKYSIVLDKILAVKTIDDQELRHKAGLLASKQSEMEEIRKWVNDGRGNDTWRQLKTPKYLRLGHI